MSSNGRLLRKLRRIMGVAVASSSLIACSSQISSAGEVRVTFDYMTGTLRFSGNGVIDNSWEKCYKVESIRSVYIENGITGICDNAFDCCENLKEVIFPDSLTSIGGLAFFGCRSLKEVDLSNTHVNGIGEHAFNLCTKLEKVTFPDSLTSIGGYAFYNCTNLEEVKFIIPSFKLNNTDCAMLKIFKEKYKKMNSKLLIANIMKYIKPNPLKELSIGNSAFQGCIKLKQIEVSNYAKINQEAFGPNTNVVRKETFVPSWYSGIN